LTISEQYEDEDEYFDSVNSLSEESDESEIKESSVNASTT